MKMGKKYDRFPQWRCKNGRIIEFTVTATEDVWDIKEGRYMLELSLVQQDIR
jgi:hypothetical protein